ncbi:MAG: oxidoreductase [Lachnoclostridium sp.]|nr:oxidoreductase [Lachnoclostridium sp.]
MRQIARIISTYSADVFGVCSALFELGGMTVMHDASGCNSTYTTHDEPRWYDMDSMVYISGLSEMEAIMGDDEKLINDIADAAEDLQPRFIAIAGTPIPAMTGFDYESVAYLIEQRTGIPTFGFPTTGMNTYVHGASMALEGYARRFVDRNVERTERLSANILGLTPLDFSVNGCDHSIAQFLEKAGFEVISKWAMGSTPEELSQAGKAHVNLVVSATGLGVAKALKEMFGTPYVIGLPYGEKASEKLAELLHRAAGGCEGTVTNWSNLPDGEIAVVGEGITSLALANAIETELGVGVKVLCATECEDRILREKDRVTMDEEEIEEALVDVKIMIADPLYRPICPEETKFIPLPVEAFSGRIFRSEIPDLAVEFKSLAEQLLQTIP